MQCPLTSFVIVYLGRRSPSPRSSWPTQQQEVHKKQRGFKRTDHKTVEIKFQTTARKIDFDLALNEGALQLGFTTK